VWFLFCRLSSVANQWDLAASVKNRQERDVVVGKIWHCLYAFLVDRVHVAFGITISQCAFFFGRYPVELMILLLLEQLRTSVCGSCSVACGPSPINGISAPVACLHSCVLIQPSTT
jgi:hypothetical protein